MSFKKLKVARILGGALGLLLALSLVLVPVPALAVQGMPHWFHGTVTIDGELAPVGTIISAQIDGIAYAPAQVDADSRYGEAPLFYVPADNPEEPGKQGGVAGETVEFYITNLAMGLDGVKANETAVFEIGGVTLLPLTVGEVPPVDNTPPTVTITPLTPDPTSDNTPTFTGTATDTESNITSVEYRVDTGSWSAATASDGTFNSLSEGYTFTTSAFPDGAHTVYVRATDAATPPNTTAVADYASDSYIVDTTGLVVTIDAVITPTNAATQTLTGTMSEGLTVVLTSAEATFGTVSYPTNITWSAVVTLVEGSNVITATAGTSTATATIVLDTTAPTVDSVSPADGATGVAVDTVVTAIFDEDVTAVSLSGITISEAANVSATLNEATNTITIAHDNFALLTNYTVTIPAGAVQDTAGNSNADHTWSFTTAMGSLQALIDDASPGEMVELEAGTYSGDVIIDKSITICGTEGTIISGSIHILPLNGSNVTIENLTITDYTAYGIQIEQVKAVDTFIIRNNTIDGAEGNVIGILVNEVDAGGILTIRQNSISGNATGIELLANVVDGDIWFNNIVDSDVGLELAAGASVSAYSNWWGDISGPEEEESNPGGIGNAIVGNIPIQGYQPWLTRPFQTVIDDNIAYLGVAMLSLNTGWNIISTPIALDSAVVWVDSEGTPRTGVNTWDNYVALGDGLAIDTEATTYYFDGDTQSYEQVLGTDQLKPVDAIYVRMAEPDIAAILYSPKVSVPAKQLYAGWNLVSLAWLPTSFEGIYGLPADEALVSVAMVTGGLTGYVLVVSPSVNPYEGSWIYTAGQSIGSWTDPEAPPPDDWMLPTSGYWVFMLNDGTLAGFTFTPMSL